MKGHGRVLESYPTGAAVELAAAEVGAWCPDARSLVRSSDGV